MLPEVGSHTHTGEQGYYDLHVENGMIVMTASEVLQIVVNIADTITAPQVYRENEIVRICDATKMPLKFILSS